MSRLGWLGARTGRAVVVLLGWALVMLGAALPGGAGALRFQQLALAVTTLTAAVVTLLAARGRGPGRRVWALLGLGLLGYAGGFVIQFWFAASQQMGPGGLNLSDASSLLLYPLADAGLLVLARQRAGRRDTGSILEAGLVFSGVTAVSVTAVCAAYPSLLRGSLVHVVYALAYPVGGFTLFVVTLTGLSLTGGRIDRTWRLLLFGFALMTVGDALYGLATVAGRFHFGSYLDVLYTGGPVFVALAATYAPTIGTAAARRRSASSALPALATLTALAVLVAGSYTMVPMVAVWSASLCVVLAVCRTSQLFAQGRVLERTRAQARTDELTGLANRRALLEAITATAKQLPPSADRPLELLLLDLDGFKEVNDSLGHAAGDDLLAMIAGLLRSTATGCLVARLGGDEFAVLMPRGMRSARTGQTGQQLAAALRTVIGRPVLVATTQVVVGVSIGHVALTELGQPGEVSSELLRRADLALYRAKDTHIGTVSWDATLDQQTRDRLTLLSELRVALRAGDQMHAWYQPKTDPRNGNVVGFEALVRWQHPTRGLLLPGDFLPAVERSGLLPALTLQVLGQAIAFLQELLASGRDVHIAVNLGAPDLLDADLPKIVAQLLREHAVAPQHLRLEVTETVVMSDPDRIIATLLDLRSLGVGLSLDDYGTGLSSLGYLRLLPIDELKIDRSFVRDLLSDESCALIVASTIGLAHDLRLRVVAEGVEDQPTLEALADAGCDTVQGWHTGRPVSPGTIRHQRFVPQPRPRPDAGGSEPLTTVHAG